MPGEKQKRICHTLSSSDALASLQATEHGLNPTEVEARQVRYGRNTLPSESPPSLAAVFFAQFTNPLIYVLLIAAIISLFIQNRADASLIFAVLLINAAVGTYQEYSAGRAAQALQKLVTLRSRVVRSGETCEIDAEDLVPGDIVTIESGWKIPADLRLIDSYSLSIDESLLTGESLPIAKNAAAVLPIETPLAERHNMAFAGTMVAAGRGRCVVTATGSETELGRIATSVIGRETRKPPLLMRMETFTRRIGIGVALAAIGVAGIEIIRGTPPVEIFMVAVALAVSAIPEGLPVALTVALAVGMQRMARRCVIVRKLVAVESLGSCTCIATDKTGTLTMNRITVTRMQFADGPPIEVTGKGIEPLGRIILPEEEHTGKREELLSRLCRAVVLANEATLALRVDEWIGQGDPLDVALLAFAHKGGITQSEAWISAQPVAAIPYEPQARFGASLNLLRNEPRATVKGAVETILPMCSRMVTIDGEVTIDTDTILARTHTLAAEGYRVLAIADGPVSLTDHITFSREHLEGLIFLGLVAMSDPLRPETRGAIEACSQAGIRIVMLTGDHPATAFAIASELGLAKNFAEVVTGADLAAAAHEGPEVFAETVRQTTVFARIEPQQKLDVVAALQHSGHIVAVTGDGVNDAPALRAAHVGVAMGMGGTDAARETSDLVISDDNFASIVAGIEEGRVAYSNVRKVIFLLISTGLAEIVLFALALAFGLPLPLTAGQLLWLNLVTNGIQDVALAFEPAEGNELKRPPRPPGEPVFNRIMIERVILSAIVIGSIAFGLFAWMIEKGLSPGEARNLTLFLMVLFENVQAFNSRSETLSVFQHSPMRNKFLLAGTIAAQLVHIAALYIPGLSQILGVQPITALQWGTFLALALVLLVIMELHKMVRRFTKKI